MAAPHMTIKMDEALAPLWLASNGFSCVAGRWMSKTRWATVTPLLRGRVSVTVGVAAC